MFNKSIETEFYRYMNDNSVETDLDRNIEKINEFVQTYFDKNMINKSVDTDYNLNFDKLVGNEYDIDNKSKNKYFVEIIDGCKKLCEKESSGFNRDDFNKKIEYEIINEFILDRIKNPESSDLNKIHLFLKYFDDLRKINTKSFKNPNEPNIPKSSYLKDDSLSNSDDNDNFLSHILNSIKMKKNKNFIR
jgi:hypothetical protein